MAKEFAKAFYSSKAWLQCRDSFIKDRIRINGGLCQRCNKEPGYIVHHKTYLSPDNINDPNIALNFENLEYVCHDCHNDEHMGVKPLKCMFDEKGRPINVNA